MTATDGALLTDAALRGAVAAATRGTPRWYTERRCGTAWVRMATYLQLDDATLDRHAAALGGRVRLRQVRDDAVLVEWRDGVRRLAAPPCPRCKRPLTPREVGHAMCRRCAEIEMAQILGAGVLDLPGDWTAGDGVRR